MARFAKSNRHARQQTARARAAQSPKARDSRRTDQFIAGFFGF